MVEYDKLFIKIPNNMIRNKYDERGKIIMNSIIKDNGNIILGIYCCLSRYKNLENKSRTTLKEMMDELGYKPDRKEGSTNSKFIKAYEWLIENELIVHLKGNHNKINELLVCEIIEINKEYFELKYKHLDKIKDTYNLVVFCNIVSRLSKWDFNGEHFYQCFPSIETLVKDTGFSDKTIQKCLKELKEKELLYYDNIGYITDKETDICKSSNNVYTLNKEDLGRALELSEYYYKSQGFKTTKKNKI